VTERRFIERKLAEYKQMEDTYRLKRQVLEELLKEIDTTSAEVAATTDTMITTKHPQKPLTGISQKIYKPAVEIMSDGQPHQLFAVLHAIEKQINRNIPASTFRTTFDKVPGLSKIARGTYIIQKNEGTESSVD
jgi:hypothetical protein